MSGTTDLIRKNNYYSIVLCGTSIEEVSYIYISVIDTVNILQFHLQAAGETIIPGSL